MLHSVSLDLYNISLGLLLFLLSLCCSSELSLPQPIGFYIFLLIFLLVLGGEWVGE